MDRSQDSLRRTWSRARACRDTGQGRWPCRPGSATSRAADTASHRGPRHAPSARIPRTEIPAVRVPSWFRSRVPRAAKAHRARAVCGLHARQHRDAHHHGVVVLLLEAQRAGAAEPVAVWIALLAAVVTHHHGTGILDPLPYHSVQIAD